jgi:hypothetical protein
VYEGDDGRGIVGGSQGLVAERRDPLAKLLSERDAVPLDSRKLHASQKIEGGVELEDSAVGERRVLVLLRRLMQPEAEVGELLDDLRVPVAVGTDPVQVLLAHVEGATPNPRTAMNAPVQKSAPGERSVSNVPRAWMAST